MSTNLNNYTVTFDGRCPVDDEHISYTLHLQSDKLLMAEDLLATVDGDLGKKLHEEIADALFAKYGGAQSLEAAHKDGRVRIVTVRE